MKNSNPLKRYRPASRVRLGLSLSAFVAACAFYGIPSAAAIDVGTTVAGSTVSRYVPDAVRTGQALHVSELTAQKHLKLALSLPQRNQAELDQLLLDLQNPQSPQFHKYLSVEEFTARFGPTQQDYETVVAWAKANGLNVTSTTANRRVVDIEGAVETINRAFKVQLGNYQHPTEDRLFYAPDTTPTAVGLSVPLLHVSGLDNFKLPHPRYKRAGSQAAHAATGSGPGGEYLPSDMRAAYYGSGPLTGTGQSIGIFSYDGYKSSDVTLFFTKTGMSSNVPINNVLVNGFSGACGGGSNCDDGEQILDIVNTIGMAPGLSQVLFYEGDSATDILNKMVSDNKAKILSCSWYDGDFDNLTDDPIYQEMAAQGQTFVNASGDDGSYSSSAWGPPSADPNVLEVGGTSLTTNGAGGSWASETSWTDSGGGFYGPAGESTPSYQMLAGVITSMNKGSTTYRNDPDIAAEADFDNPTVSNGTFETGYGGTSFAAPRWAGFLALVNQQAATNGHGPVGFINPAIYNVALSTNYLSSFHDITTGSNGGFTAVAGYDLVTGWGSPRAALIALLAGSGGGGGSAPVANFADVVSGLTVNFTDSSTDTGGTISSHAWNFGDAGTSTSTNPSHTYAAAGTYSVTLTVTDNTGATNTKTQSVTVSSGGGGGNVLTNGVPVTGLSGATGALSSAYTLSVPAGKTKVVIKISGGTGDADLYVKAGSAPTTSSYDCRPYVSGNSETCTLTPPSGGGTYYVKLNGYAKYSGVSLVGSYSP